MKMNEGIFYTDASLPARRRVSGLTGDQSSELIDISCYDARFADDDCASSPWKLMHKGSHGDLGSFPNPRLDRSRVRWIRLRRLLVCAEPRNFNGSSPVRWCSTGIDQRFSRGVGEEMVPIYVRDRRRHAGWICATPSQARSIIII